jgi:hypothetical protein
MSKFIVKQRSADARGHVHGFQTGAMRLALKLPEAYAVESRLSCVYAYYSTRGLPVCLLHGTWLYDFDCYFC